MIKKIEKFLGLKTPKNRDALVDDELFGKVAKDTKPDHWVRSTCGYCGVGCGLYIGVKDNRAVLTKGDPSHPVNLGTLCPKGLSEHEIIQSPSRATTPMIKKDGSLRSVSWEEAFGKVSQKFKDTQDRYGKGAVACISTGQLLSEEFYALGKFMQLGLQSNNFDGNTTLCMSSAVMGYKQSFGSDGPPGCYEDFSHADVIMLIGANIADNHPILKLHIAKNQKITGKKPTIIVVDPRHSKTANMADIFVPLNPRSDLALINGLCYIIFEQGWEDEGFLKDRVEGLKEFKKHIMNNYPPAEVANITGIDVTTLYKLAQTYAGADSAMSAWTMGVNQSAIGTDTVSSICNLALITGNIGKAGGAPMSITGQCNAMGTRESGFTSSIPGYRNFASLEDREEYASIVGVSPDLVPSKRGYSYPQIIDAIDKGEIKALWVVATNPVVSFVDQNRLRDALKKLDILVVQDAYMSETALEADVIFPAAVWGEKEGTYTNSERRCNRAKKAVKPIGECKSDFDIVLEFSEYFSKRELLFNGWSSPQDAFDEWKRVSKGRLCDYSGMSYELIEELGGVQWPCNSENPKGAQRLYTDGGSLNLICTDWKELKYRCDENFPLTLNTGRTVEQWHTRTKTKNIAILDDLAPRAWCEINPKDADLLQVKSGDFISISSARGRVDELIVKVSESVRASSIFVPFHFSEQLINRVTNSEFDPKSFEPNFKQSAVQLHSKKVPQGIEYKKELVCGELTYQKVDQIIIKERDSVKTSRG